MPLGKTITVAENDKPILRITRQQVEGGAWEVTVYKVEKGETSKDLFMSYRSATLHIADVIKDTIERMG